MKLQEIFLTLYSEDMTQSEFLLRSSRSDKTSEGNDSEAAELTRGFTGDMMDTGLTLGLFDCEI